MDNPLTKLALDYWYKVFMVVGVVVFLSSGAGILSAYPIIPTATISLGCFFVGLGEWINHPLQTVIMRASAYYPGGVLTGHPRKPKSIGIAFDAGGVSLIGFGLYRLFT